MMRVVGSSVTEQTKSARALTRSASDFSPRRKNTTVSRSEKKPGSAPAKDMVRRASDSVRAVPSRRAGSRRNEEEEEEEEDEDEDEPPSRQACSLRANWTAFHALSR